ncbi:hypothetical protein QYF36_020122 [Acer negundo]|nr:hypothetical protein QYF36_020122 [Acer negundo]
MLKCRGFHFQSSYIGGKFILWRFQSAYDCDGFINNKFFWANSYMSMSKWSSRKISKLHPEWISLGGVLLNVWNEYVFKQIGGMLREVLLIDDEDSKRVRLDRVRMLVCLPYGCSLPQKIIVYDGNKTFDVFVEKDMRIVKNKWLKDYLGLNQVGFSEEDDDYPNKEYSKSSFSLREEDVSFFSSSEQWQENEKEVRDKPACDGDVCGDSSRLKSHNQLKRKGDRQGMESKVNYGIKQH